MDPVWILLCVFGGIIVVALALAVDKRTKFPEDTDEEEIQALLGVVLPKTEEKEEK